MDKDKEVIWLTSIFVKYGKDINNLEKGQYILFDCPICGNPIYLFKSSRNGHISCKCETCDIHFMQ